MPGNDRNSSANAHSSSSQTVSWKQTKIKERRPTYHYAGNTKPSHNVRRSARKVIKAVGLTPQEWTPREMRHSFVSVMSASGAPVEDIARLVGHSGTRVTELVYRKQIRPVIVEGATAMDSIFRSHGSKR
ncbi:tyrosine-type recombinase/integrase [Saccharopolyspora sp. NPDC002376]